MFREFPGQSRATQDLIEKTANHLLTTDTPDSCTSGENFLSVFFGGEMIDMGTYSGGFTAELIKLYQFHAGEVVERKVGTRYQRIDFFTSGHVPIYETYRYPHTHEFKGYIFSLYENQELSNPVTLGDIPRGFEWSKETRIQRIKALVNKAPVFYVNVPIGDPNSPEMSILFEKLHARIKTMEQALKDQEEAEKNRKNNEIAETLKRETLDRVNRALDFFEEESSQP